MADNKQLPTFDELPNFHEYTGCAWGVWGKDDQLGTINLLTEKVVAESAKEIKCVHPHSTSMQGVRAKSNLTPDWER